MTQQYDAARRSFDEFVRAESEALIRSAYLLVGDRHHAEDLVQTALARAVTRWHKIDDHRAYVYRVLYTQFVSWWRRRWILPHGGTITVDGTERRIFAATHSRTQTSRTAFRGL